MNELNSELQMLSDEYNNELIDYQYDELQLELNEMLNQFSAYHEYLEESN
jgi:hypothetical protein